MAPLSPSRPAHTPRWPHPRCAPSGPAPHCRSGARRGCGSLHIRCTHPSGLPREHPSGPPRDHPSGPPRAQRDDPVSDTKRWADLLLLLDALRLISLFHYYRNLCPEGPCSPNKPYMDCTTTMTTIHISLTQNRTLRVTLHWPVLRSQSLTSPSKEPETKCDPSE